MASGRSRTRYRLDPTSWQRRLAHGAPVTRAVERADRDALAALMLDAYAGTIDDEGEDLDGAIGEVDQWFAGSAMLDASRVLTVDGVMASACLVDVYDELPWIAYVVTGSAHTGQGLGRAAADDAIGVLAAAGHREAGLVITDGNVASERIFAGATPLPPDA